MSAAVAFAPSIVNRGVHLHPLSLNNAPTKALVGASLKGYSLHCIIFRTATDSAMGSGHFLVNAAYQVANFVVDLLETNCWDNDEINADVVYWKRRVVENCIYGIDINKLSVLLARLSLWLISASNDKALSFIDHHLKCGNSIVGTSLNRVQYYNKDIPILSVYKEQYMYPIIKKYEEIKCIGSDTKDDVAQQHRIYDEIVSDLRLVRRKFDYYLASLYAGGVEDELELFNALTAYDESYFNNVKFDALFEYADSQRFFHWELEFPEVYMNGGFDAAM